MAYVLDLRQDKIKTPMTPKMDGIFASPVSQNRIDIFVDLRTEEKKTAHKPHKVTLEGIKEEYYESDDQIWSGPDLKRPKLIFYPEKTLSEQIKDYYSKLNLNISNLQIFSLIGFVLLSILVNAKFTYSRQMQLLQNNDKDDQSSSWLEQLDLNKEMVILELQELRYALETNPEYQDQYALLEAEVNAKELELIKTNHLASLPAAVALVEKYRPDEDWLNQDTSRYNSEIYAPQSEIWRDDQGRVMRIEDGFVIMKIPQYMAPVYELVEARFGISRYVLMAVATIESKQGISMISTTNCRGWGHYCPSTVRLFQRKALLPLSFDTYDRYYGIAGIAVHLWVSSLGLTEYRELTNHYAEPDGVPWPHFWQGETPDYELFESHSWSHPIIPATWGYNRNAFYGYSVAKLAQFYQMHDN